MRAGGSKSNKRDLHFQVDEDVRALWIRQYADALARDQRTSKGVVAAQGDFLRLVLDAWVASKNQKAQSLY